MIIVEPAGARYEGIDPATSNDEHLLERISALENRLDRLTDKLDRGLDLLLRQAQHSHFDRALIKALTAILTDDGTVEPDRLERLWMHHSQKDAEEQLESERREDLRLRLLATHHSDQPIVFEQYLNEGFLLLEDDQTVRGIRALQRAASADNDNATLLYFIGECYFRLGKTRQAQAYLARAHDLTPRDGRVSLLLGLTCADEGEVERARELLNSATRLGGSTFAAHYGLGRLFVAEAKWPRALQEFKLALASKNSPEAHYALGCLYYQLSRDAMATRHLRKALQLDPTYVEAFQLFGLICERGGQQRLAEDYFERASAAAGKPKRKLHQTASLFHSFPTKSRRLITGGDRRLAEALRQDALNAFSER